MRNCRVSSLKRGLVLLLSVACCGAAAAAAEPQSIAKRFDFLGSDTQSLELKAGETVEISAGVTAPSQLPANGRVAVEWSAPAANAGFRKVLHALDPDVYVIYRAPQAGRYTLSLRAVEDEEPVFKSPRWRENGVVSELKPFPRLTPWPAGHKVPMQLAVRATDFGESARGLIVETEPNNSREQAQPIALKEDQIVRITGGADDIEYFDNGAFGESGDDWYRVEYKGSEPRLLSANMMPTDHFVAGRIRVYSPDGEEYTDGKHLNETAHDQVEEHRTAVVRTLKPGGVYLLRVEANSPGYDLEIRARRPAPFTDPRDAVRLAMYDHVAQISAWLMNRPRGNSLDRRLRDTGTMYGSNCMSCHTQSGVWGPAVPIAFGYRVENPLHYRHLMNIMYESLRPTNVLKDAANNTSLPPHDLGDGPAGTRVAGHNVLTAEAVIAPRKLHSKQQIRTANYILQTADPTGINAAGPGSNVGQSVVFHYASEILRRAWDKTGEARYLDGIVERAEKLLKVEPKFTDDIAHRILFFRRVFPTNYAALKGDSEDARKLENRAAEQLKLDETSLRKSQRDDGAWGFAPGKVDATPDPSPTALSIDALVSLGAGKDDLTVARGVQALLKLQYPYGLWNRSARTGFVTTSYVLNTLSRLYPDEQPKLARRDFEPVPGESLSDTIARMRMLAQLAPWSAVSTAESPEQYLDLMQTGATHPSAPVRYWAMIALGACHTQSAVEALIQGMDDPVKMVREAARWGLRQTLLDDHGWEQVFAAYDHGSDLQRQELAAALIMRADGVMSGASVDFERLAATLDQMMSQDANPAVRAWAPRAAWNWWLWNQPTRKRLNQAYLTMLETPEPSVLAENAKRYQLQALFIVNGNRASANYDNPYKELADLFQAINARISSGPASGLLAQRLVGVAATYYNASYGSNGTGQLGYSTPRSSETIGKAVMNFWEDAEAAKNPKLIQLAVEASANVVHTEVQKKLLDYAVNGPEALRPIASNALSDPRAVLLPTSPEFIGPLMERLHKDAQSDDGRRRITRTTIRQLSQARWDMPRSEERQREFFGYLVPKLDDPSSELQWFLAENLGRVLAANPDLHTEVLLSMVPQSFGSPLEQMLWLSSAGWMMTYDSPIPEVGQPILPENRSELRRFALDLYLKCLSPDADRRLRTRAVAMLSLPVLYANPEVIAAAGHIDTGDWRRYLPDRFDADIHQAAEDDAAESKLALTPERIRNFTYFRNFVIPELALENRMDGNSCFTCHGGGKVPSMPLVAPERRSGYLSPKGMWTDYRTLLARIDMKDAERSRVLRKPLNIQSGQEDGHQGDMRYKPGDRGHEILKRWVLDAATLK